MIIVNDFKHTKHVGFSENNEFKISAENEELANELIAALHLKINNKGEMQDVMSVIDQFGADQVSKQINMYTRKKKTLRVTTIPNTSKKRGSVIHSILTV